MVDLVVGSLLFRRGFVGLAGHGHIDLPRARAAGVDLVGMTIVTRFPNRRGTLSGPHFHWLGLSPEETRSDLAMVTAFVRRLEAWAEASRGDLEVAREPADLDRVGLDGITRAFVGVQGGHAIVHDLANVAMLRALGVRMLAPAHTMDTPLVGSNTGIRRGGLTGLGREAIAELEHQGIVVDLAHMSSAGVRQTVPLLQRPFVLSHTGFQALVPPPGRLRIRRYRPFDRNVSAVDARLVAEAGGVIGVVAATALLGGSDVDALVRSVDQAVALAGPHQVAIGSDFDGGLRTVFDVTGLPRLTQGLLDAGHDRTTVAAIMGGNGLRVLRSASVGPPAIVR